MKIRTRRSLAVLVAVVGGLLALQLAKAGEPIGALIIVLVTLVLAAVCDDKRAWTTDESEWDH